MDTERPTVAVVRCGYDSAQAAIERLLDLLEFGPPRRVLLKPNLLIPSRPEQAICTHPAVICSMVRVLKQLDPEVEVGVGDSPGVGSARRVLSRLGALACLDELGAQVIEFTHTIEETCPDGILRSYPLAAELKGYDALVDLAKLKTHLFTRYSGAVKNLFGCVPGAHKPELHLKLPQEPLFSRALVDICRLVRPQLTIIDGVLAMEGNGPRGGSPTHLGVLIASRDPVAADAVACRLIGLDPLVVSTLAAAHEQGIGCADLKQITVVGDPLPTCPDFVLPAPAERVFQGVRAVLRHLAKRALLSKPRITSSCIGCGTCTAKCPHEAMRLEGSKVVIDYTRCRSCFCCHELCSFDAIKVARPLLSRLVFRH